MPSPDHAGYAAVVAHSLLNAVGCVRTCLDTLSDEDVALSTVDRARLHETATREVERITDALRRFIYMVASPSEGWN
jgi:hypothetical protein